MTAATLAELLADPKVRASIEARRQERLKKIIDAAMRWAGPSSRCARWCLGIWRTAAGSARWGIHEFKQGSRATPKGSAIPRTGGALLLLQVRNGAVLENSIPQIQGRFEGGNARALTRPLGPHSIRACQWAATVGAGLCRMQ